jgi:hypothetical protein
MGRGGLPVHLLARKTDKRSWRRPRARRIKQGQAKIAHWLLCRYASRVRLNEVPFTTYMSCHINRDSTVPVPHPLEVRWSPSTGATATRERRSVAPALTVLPTGTAHRP